MRIRRPAPMAALSWLVIGRVVAVLFLFFAVAACQNGQDTGDDTGQNTESNSGQDSSAEDIETGSTAGAVHGIEGVPDYMVKGDPDAGVTMIEWSDYQ